MSLGNSREVRSPGRRARLVLPQPRPAAGAALAGLALALAVAAPARGATFTVNSTMDSSDGSCSAAPGGCTLREAIEAAVATAGRDTIDFDGEVFLPGPNPVQIVLGSALPIIADPAGTTLTGAGASVRIDGSSTVADGLVFASAPGVPLGRVSVANVTVHGFTHHGIHVCGGWPPACDGDVSDAHVRSVVAVTSGASGIVIQGRVNKRPRVTDSVTFQSGEDGIWLNGSQAMTGARVEGCTASRSGLRGIALTAEQQSRSMITDSFGSKSGGDGIVVAGDGSTVEPEITDVVAWANGDGIALNDVELVAPLVSNVVASGNAGRGIVVASQNGTDAVLRRIRSDSNRSYGILLDGLGTGAKIVGARVVGNEEFGIHTAAETGLIVKDVLAAANYGGVSLSAADGTLERVNASGSYAGTGITIFAGGGNSITDSAALGNGAYGYGIWIDLGSGGNSIAGNVALGNGFDLVDDNDDCDGNVWAENTYLSENRPCIH